MILVSRGLACLASILFLAACPAEDEPLDAASSQTSAGSTTNGTAHDEVGEGTDSCGDVEEPEGGFCNCEDCDSPALLDCPPLTISCALNEDGATLNEACVDPVADDDAALECILDFLRSNAPVEATARWEVVFGDQPAMTARLGRRAIRGTSRSAWTFGTDPKTWESSGVTREGGLNDEGQACLDLEPEARAACLHELIDLLDPATCFGSIDKECA